MRVPVGSAAGYCTEKVSQARTEPVSRPLLN